MAFKMKGITFDTGEKFHICKSNIDGQGAIASQDIKKGELIGTAIKNEQSVKPGFNKIQTDTRTRLGQILNHQDDENAVQKSESNQLNVYAKKDISKGDEITINYVNAPDYINKDVSGYKS
tara:strand:+ start:750 stop:1112 length:363 start_codon:yes stop_codon:yes gene_type:complete